MLRKTIDERKKILKVKYIDDDGDDDDDQETPERSREQTTCLRLNEKNQIRQMNG